MYSKNNHINLYSYMLASVPKSTIEYNLATYILSATGNYDIANNMGGGRKFNQIDFDSMTEKLELNSTEIILLQIAGNLYDNRECDLSVLYYLDEGYLDVLVHAIRKRINCCKTN